MRVVLIGADFEENLGLGMIGAAAEAAGHEVSVMAFNDRAQGAEVARRVGAAQPDVVGLGIQFQHRAYDFLALARALRREGFAGHVTAGGQFPTLAFREVLERGHGVDSVVLYDGEATFVELLSALDQGRPLTGVAGLALLDDGKAQRTAERALDENLDALPFAKRYRPHSRHVGIPFVPIMGARGCWGSCSYCSITTFYRDARAHGGGHLLRLRSPANVAEEMAALWHAAGGPAVFCFHDDNFLLPRPAASLARVRAVRQHLDALGVGKVGIIGKCRPETLTADLARELAALGVVRLYVGVENVAESGARGLNRGVQHAAVTRALDACQKAGIFSCYNLLLFEPGATLAAIRENIAFMRAHATHPVNFCRAEPYYGTPLMQSLAAGKNLGGSYLGWDYRLHDDRAELLFRISSAVFRERNFRCDGVANRYMGLGYAAKLLEHFHAGPQAACGPLVERAQALTRAITLDTAAFLDRAVALAETPDLGDRRRIERETALLGLEVAATDSVWQHELDLLFAEIEAFARPRAEPPRRTSSRRRPSLARTLALGVSLAACAANCGGESTSDQKPADGGKDDHFVADPLPPDGSVDAPDDTMVVDAVPSDAGVDADSDAGDGGADADADVWVADPPPADAALEPELRVPASRRPLDQWVDTSPKRSARARDLPLYEPPDVRIVARREGSVVKAELRGVPAGATTRWEARGEITGAGHSVTWVPDATADDSLRVAVRTTGGVAVVSVRAKAVHEA